MIRMFWSAIRVTRAVAKKEAHEVLTCVRSSQNCWKVDKNSSTLTVVTFIQTCRALVLIHRKLRLLTLSFSLNHRSRGYSYLNKEKWRPLARVVRGWKSRETNLEVSVSPCSQFDTKRNLDLRRLTMIKKGRVGTLSVLMLQK